MRTQEKSGARAKRIVPTAEWDARYCRSQCRSIIIAITLMCAAWAFFTYACFANVHKPGMKLPPRFGDPQIVRLNDGRMAVVKCRKFSVKDHVWIYTVSILEQ